MRATLGASESGAVIDSERVDPGIYSLTIKLERTIYKLTAQWFPGFVNTYQETEALGLNARLSILKTVWSAYPQALVQTNQKLDTIGCLGVLTRVVEDVQSLLGLETTALQVVSPQAVHDVLLHVQSQLSFLLITLPASMGCKPLAQKMRGQKCVREHFLKVRVITTLVGQLRTIDGVHPDLPSVVSLLISGTAQYFTLPEQLRPKGDVPSRLQWLNKFWGQQENMLSMHAVPRRSKGPDLAAAAQRAQVAAKKVQHAVGKHAKQAGTDIKKATGRAVNGVRGTAKKMNGAFARLWRRAQRAAGVIKVKQVIEQGKPKAR